MNPKYWNELIWMTLFMVIPAVAYGDDPPARPGKGLSFIPGDYAEYSNTEFLGENKRAMPSSIMIAIGKENELEGVMLYSVRGNKLVSIKQVFYDLTRAKMEQGELLETGKESLTIDGKNCDCTWEKRRNQNVVGTFWTCSELPFEKVAKVQMEADDGRKMITELVSFGPDINDEQKSKAFHERLKKIQSSGGSNK